MFSIFPPFYYGAFNAVISYITVIIVLLMHMFCFMDTRVKGVSLWALFYFLYYFLIFIWIIVGLILAYIWSKDISTFSGG
jgi:hypothetical protein